MPAYIFGIHKQNLSKDIKSELAKLYRVVQTQYKSQCSLNSIKTVQLVLLRSSTMTYGHGAHKSKISATYYSIVCLFIQQQKSVANNYLLHCQPMLKILSIHLI